MRRITALLGTTLFIAALASHTVERHASASEELHRIAVKNQWVAAAKKIAGETRDIQAKAVVDAVLGSLVAVMPVPQGVRLLESAKPDGPWTGFLPLLPTDLSKPYLGHLTAAGNIFAQYQPENNVIIVKEFSSSSEFWKGIMLLHEGQHASDMIFATYEWRNPQVFAEKERDVHNFQNRLMSKIGGANYHRLLQHEITRIRADLTRQGLKGFQRQPGAETRITVLSRTAYYAELDTVFSPALSQLEKDARQTHFWFHAVFAAFEEDRGKNLDAEVGKAAFLRAVYKQGNVFGR